MDALPKWARELKESKGFGRELSIVRLVEFTKNVFRHKDAITQAFRSSWEGINFRQKEDHIVHDYIISESSGIHYLNETISPLLSCNDFIVKFAGVFVHQKPMVGRQNLSCAPKKKKNCELGDLLTLFLYIDSSKNVLQKKLLYLRLRRI